MAVARTNFFRIALQELNYNPLSINLNIINRINVESAGVVSAEAFNYQCFVNESRDVFLPIADEQQSDDIKTQAT